MNRIYKIKIDSDFDLRLKEFENQLSENEEIVSTSLNNEYYIIVTKEIKYKQIKNLLFEEMNIKK